MCGVTCGAKGGVRFDVARFKRANALAAKQCADAGGEQ